MLRDLHHNALLARSKQPPFRRKASMKREIAVGQTFQRGSARGKLWQVEELLVWPSGIHVRLSRVDDPTTKHLVAADALEDNGYQPANPASV
jgi:hypothetical protein